MRPSLDWKVKAVKVAVAEAPSGLHFAIDDVLGWGFECVAQCDAGMFIPRPLMKVPTVALRTKPLKTLEWEAEPTVTM